jgi:hypothetical protein
MNVNRLVIVGIGCGVVWWGLEVIDIRVVVGGETKARRR